MTEILPFTSHNTLLPDGTYTAPSQPVVAASGACHAALTYLGEQFTTPAGVTVADLGCLEGGYAAEFARAGYDVTGIEVREENYARAQWLKDQLGLPNLRFLCNDVRTALPGMEFDAIFCCGLLYHLDKPVEFINMLGQATRRLLILNTHYSMGGGHPEHIHQPGESCDHSLSVNEGKNGHWFFETENRWASYGNKASFWLTREDLIKSLADAGFSDITETYDWRRDGLPWGSGGAFADRGMFVAVKE